MALPVKIARCFGVLEEKKFQITNIKEITMTNPPAADQTCFGH
jgi:hypothetical protein